MMKKIGFLFGLILATTNAHAVFDLGVVGGVTTNLQSGTTPAFTYGLTGSFGTGIMLYGAKITNYSFTGGSQLNALAQIKYSSMGFFIGAEVGPSFVSAGATTTQVLFGPTVGYYTGTGLKYGVEVDYLLSSLGGSGVLVPMAGIKFGI